MLFRSDVTRVWRLGVAAACAAALGALLFAIATVFGAMGAYMTLAVHYRPEVAAFILAGAVLVLAAVSAGIACLVARACARNLNTAATIGGLAALAPVAVSAALKHRRLMLGLLVAGIGAWAAGRRRQD